MDEQGIPTMMDDMSDIVDVGIGYWQKERPEIDCTGKAVTGRILHFSEMLMAAMNANLARFGVKYSTYAIVATLRCVGAPYRMTPTQLQNTLLITSGGVSNLIRKVEAQGYVRRMVDPNDGRGTIVELTDEGYSLSEITMPAHADLEMHMVRMCSKEELELLTNLLRRMMVFNNMPQVPIDRTA
jgi:DNA-binding MarR family transcriptional regulator